MVTATRTTDDKARISLPGSFANCTVLMEQVSDTEVRIRKARVIPEDELPFVEESMMPLSDRDRDLFLALLDNPPPPNEALKRLMEEERRSEQTHRGESEKLKVSKQAKSKGSSTTGTKGQRYELFGFPITAVLRWMGKNEWTKEEALKVVKHFKIECSPSTVGIQVKAGAKGERGEPANITAEQAGEMSAIAGKSSAKSKK